MELDIQSLFRLHVHSCTHWLSPRNFPLPPHVGSSTRALLVSHDRRHLLVTPWIQSCLTRPVILSPCTALCDNALWTCSEELPLPPSAAQKEPREPLALRRRISNPAKTPKTSRAKTKSESETKPADVTDYIGERTMFFYVLEAYLTQFSCRCWFLSCSVWKIVNFDLRTCAKKLLDYNLHHIFFNPFPFFFYISGGYFSMEIFQKFLP
jgi:hypothetical protein